MIDDVCVRRSISTDWGANAKDVGVLVNASRNKVVDAIIQEVKDRYLVDVPLKMVCMQLTEDHAHHEIRVKAVVSGKNIEDLKALKNIEDLKALWESRKTVSAHRMPSAFEVASLRDNTLILHAILTEALPNWRDVYDSLTAPKTKNYTVK